MLTYISHNTSDKTTFVKVRAIVETNVICTNDLRRVFGSTGDELRECRRGIKHDIDKHPRVNAGYLGSYIKIVNAPNRIRIYHEVKNCETLLCEVVQEGGEG